ncbi:MAG: right-handed parallel beta-helix repeat-containing protein [Bryobacterales bacterium]|nr:right-handed parallel beta-helix repeat-containing protein [Bryobacterales bacterium]
MTGFIKCWLALVVPAFIQAALGQLTNFEVIDYPGAIRTFAYAVTRSGDVAGMYYSPDQKRHGFVVRQGKYTTFDFPGAPQTYVYDINDAGDIGGSYIDSDGRQHAFFFKDGQYTTIDFPGADMTSPGGINNRGDMAGMYWNRTGDTKMRGFLYSQGRFTSFEYPAPNLMSCMFSINDRGDMVGHWQEPGGATHGWLMKNGQGTSFDYPNAQSTMFDRGGITEDGDMVGPYIDLRGKTRGFLMGKNRSVTFEVPGSKGTFPFRMNASGRIAGHFLDAGGVAHGFVTSLRAPGGRLLTVDDDGMECPGAMRTIQEAVEASAGGETILVCPGIYAHSVRIAGPEKNGLKLIGAGAANEVVLQGDYTERDGFHLENVSSVLIRGFTVRDFGTKSTTVTEFGTGNLIYLENAHYNTIEENWLVNGDMMGIMMMDSGNNAIRRNVALVDNPSLVNCGIHMQGAKSAGNDIRGNVANGNQFAGIMIRGAGPGNFVMDNTVVSNGRFGIDVQNTNDIWIEGNRVSYGQGFWGTNPNGKQPGVGINLVNLSQATVFDNRARSNNGTDLSWDGKGENKIQSNACETSTPAGMCSQ